MENIFDLFYGVHGVETIMEWGVVAICAIVFVETGLFFGFFLPGDSLLVTAGIVAGTGGLPIIPLFIFVSLSAILGDQLGYFIGYKTGKFLYSRKNSLFFRREHLERTHLFYEKYGAKTIVIARFVPIVRTFAPAIAGVANMEYKKFVVYNVLGGVLWVMLTVLGGFFIGSLIPNIEHYLHLVIAIVILLSFIPIILELSKNKLPQKAAAPPNGT